MALRKASAYSKRKVVPYTRVSKKRQKSYIKTVPQQRIVKFTMGDRKLLDKGKLPYQLTAISTEQVQIRHNALEAARIAANRFLEKHLGKTNYHLKILVFPHHVMRHNPQANFAGADRFSSGMSHAFGKTLGRAAQVSGGQDVMFARFDEKNLKKVKDALRRAGNKLPLKWELDLVKL